MITINGKRRWLGSFADLESASRAYHEAATGLFGQFYPDPKELA